MSENINLFHAFAVAPFLGYIAYQNIYQKTVDVRVYYALMVLVIFMVIYHLAIYAKKTSKLVKDTEAKAETFMRRCIQKAQ